MSRAPGTLSGAHGKACTANPYECAVFISFVLQHRIMRLSSTVHFLFSGAAWQSQCMPGFQAAVITGNDSHSS